jgi:hypothetical protein
MPIVGLGYRRNSCFQDTVKDRVASHEGQERNRRKSICNIEQKSKRGHPLSGAQERKGPSSASGIGATPVFMI